MTDNLPRKFFLALRDWNGDEKAFSFNSSIGVTWASFAFVNQNKKNEHSEFKLTVVKIHIKKIMKLLGLYELLGFKF